MRAKDIDPVFRSPDEEERYAHEMANPPDPSSCFRCVMWSGDEFTEYARCRMLDWETSGSATCTRFEAKAEV